MKKVISMLLVAALALVMCSACFADENTLKIGFIGPLTGAAAVYGTSCLRALRSPWTRSTPRAACRSS